MNNKGIYYNIIKLLHFLLSNIKSNIYTFILCMCIGVSPFIINSFSNSKNYKASFTVAYDELFRKIYGDRLGKINSLVQRNEYEKVAYNLRTNIDIVKCLKSVEGKNIIGDDLNKDLNTDNVPFIVNMVVNDSSKITILQDAIVQFLETGNDFLQDRKKVRLKENTEELAFINEQMKIIDSLNKHGVTKVFEVQQNDKEKSAGSLFEFAYQLYKRKQELIRKERMPSSLFVVDDAIVSVKAGIPSVLAVGLGLLSGFVLYIVIALFIVPAVKFKE